MAIYGIPHKYTAAATVFMLEKVVEELRAEIESLRARVRALEEKR